MLTRADWAGLIPHAGRMDLLERVLYWDTGRLEAEARAPDAAHPLAHAGRVRALHACEYAAQAAAVHGGLLARAAQFAPAPGLLATLRGVQLPQEWIAPAAPLRIAVWRLAATTQAVQYRFVVAQGAVPLAQGQLLIAFGVAP